MGIVNILVGMVDGCKQPVVQKAKHAGGRPTKYRKSHCKMVVKAAQSGSTVTDEEIARLYGVSVSTVENWKLQYPEFLESVQKAKEISDDKVERSLFERATGYSHPDVHISVFEGCATITPLVKHYPPDTAAAFIWLKNRRPRKWRDKTEVEHSGNLTLNDATVALGIARGPTTR